jgi:hypothetical protein
LCPKADNDPFLHYNNSNLRQSVFAVRNTGWKDSGGTSLSVPHLPTSILALQFLEWFRFAGSTTAIVDILNQIDQLTPMV